MAFPETPLDVTVYLLLGGTYTDVTEDVYNRENIAVTWGRQDWAATADTINTPIVFNNGRSSIAPTIVGRYSRRNPNSDLFGLLGRQTRVAIDVTTPTGTVVGRFEGYIRSWPTTWDVSGNDVSTTVRAEGIRRRLLQGNKRLKDPLRRHIQANGPLMYWPLTDGENARQGSEVIAGAQPVRAIGTSGSFFQGQPDWSGGTLAPWLSPVVQLPSNTSGKLTAPVRPADVTGWAVDFFRSGPGGDDDTLTVYDTGPGTDADPLNAYIVVADRSGDQLRLDVTSFGETGTGTSTLWAEDDPGIFDESPHMIRVVVEQSGAEIAWRLAIDGRTVAFATDPSLYHPVSRFRYEWGVSAVSEDASALGHIVYWGESVPPAAATWHAAQGHSRELAGRRIERLCAEQGVELQVNGDLDLTPQMGPQKAGAFLDLLQTCADVDAGGAVHEARDTPAIAYRTARSKYNQGVS
ncbi:hypothetical protein ACKI1J_38695 [Streptomyces scabiei]|uniref:hypothetical protein n=1 Tax=Streptomyces scabiei TaxID=1930 RepID=UPI0039EE622B